MPIERVRRHQYPLKPEKIFFRTFRDLSGAPRPFRLGLAALARRCRRQSRSGSVVSWLFGGLAVLIVALGAAAIAGPGFFVPVRNSELLSWLFAHGFEARWPAALMTKGPYQEPREAFLPSIAF